MTRDTFRRFLDQWVQPGIIISMATCIFGGIVWGVQLNSRQAQNIEMLGELRALVTLNSQQIASQTILVERQLILLEKLDENVTHDRNLLDDHLREAEVWKQKIHGNGIRIDIMERQNNTGNNGKPMP